MKKDLKKKESKQVDEDIVIPDECGDSMWDSVLAQSPFVQAIKKKSEKKAAGSEYKKLSTD